MIQLHGNESSEACLQLKSSGLPVIKAFNIDRDFDFESLNQYMPGCDYFLFDTKSEKPGGSGKKFAWEKLEAYSLDKPFSSAEESHPMTQQRLKSIINRGLFAVDTKQPV